MGLYRISDQRAKKAQYQDQNIIDAEFEEVDEQKEAQMKQDIEKAFGNDGLQMVSNSRNECGH